MMSAVAERIEADMKRLRDIGTVMRQEGVSRIAYTTAENTAHDHIRSRMEEEGLETRVDNAGNLYGLLHGEGQRIAIGSHLDSVNNGGNYDGALGVVMGLEAARILKEEKPRHSLEIVAFRAEESTRFSIGCLGSKLATGYLTQREALKIRDKEGITLQAAAKASGFDINGIELWKKNDVALYIEPHIEQADVLMEAGFPIGIVTSIRAPARYEITISGEEAHSGATPMHARKDAIAAFNEMGLAVERIAQSYGNEAVATIPTMRASATQSINKVAGYASFGLDMRANTPEVLEELERRILEEITAIAMKRDVRIVKEFKEKGRPIKLRKQDYTLVRRAAATAGISAMEMPSGAAHDAQYVALLGIPTAMIFIRNRNGSHNPYETADAADVELGTKVLVQTILEADKR